MGQLRLLLRRAGTQDYGAVNGLRAEATAWLRAGHGVGAQLVDWAGVRASREYGAQWVRVDVWTTNTALHDYYVHLGFDFCGLSKTIDDYPSAALFQKPVHQIKPPEEPLFQEIPEAG